MNLDESDLRILVGAISEQQYGFHVLLTLLTERGIIKQGEVESRLNEKDRFKFNHDLLDFLVSIGLKIPGSLPSALTQETPSANAQVAKASTDPESQKNFSGSD